MSASVPSSCSSPIYVYDYPKADFNSLCSFLFDFDFTSCLLSHDVDSVWNTIKLAIYEGMNLFIPRVRLCHHKYPCCYTPELRHLSKCLYTLCKKVSKKPTSYFRNKLEQQTLALSDKIQSAKSLYESQLVANCAGNCNSKIYDYIRSLSNNSSIPSTVFLNSASATSDLEICSTPSSTQCIIPVQRVPCPYPLPSLLCPTLLLQTFLSQNLMSFRLCLH